MILFHLLSVSLAAKTLILTEDDRDPAIATLKSSLIGEVSVAKFSDNPALHRFGAWNFETVVIASSRLTLPGREGTRDDSKFRSVDLEVAHARNMEMAKLRPVLSSLELLDFVDAGNNLMIMVEESSKELEVLLRGVGMELLDRSVPISLSEASLAPVVLGRVVTESLLSSQSSPILRHKNSLKLSHSNKLVFPVLSDRIGALQARNGARVLVASCFRCLTEDIALVREVFAWTSQRKAVLRVAKVAHQKVGDATVYRMKDELEFSVLVEEFKSGSWVPYVADDLQVEYTMLDPHVRLNLVPSSTGLHSVRFKSPDVYGIFKFEFDYNRKGYNALHVERQATLRNYRHDDYERFIFGAAPYYVSSFVSAIGVVVFSVLFLHCDSRMLLKKLE